MNQDFKPKAIEVPKQAPNPQSGPAAAPAREFVLPKKSKVAVVGCADSKDEVVFNDPDCEFWGVNNLHLTMPGPWSRWFDLHTFRFDGNRWLRRGDPDFRTQPIDKYLQSLQSLNIPVYMQAANPLVTNAVLYPINEILAKYGNYFTNTISYMIVMAMEEGFKEIQILGVDMAVDSEYKWQRPSCEYFIGLARGLGINVYLPESCDLLKTRYLYAFHEVREQQFNQKLAKMGKAMKMRRETAVNEMEKARKQADFFQRQMYEYNGALAARDQIAIHWSNTVDMWPPADKKKKGGADENI